MISKKKLFKQFNLSSCWEVLFLRNSVVSNLKNQPSYQTRWTKFNSLFVDCSYDRLLLNRRMLADTDWFKSVTPQSVRSHRSPLRERSIVAQHALVYAVFPAPTGHFIRMVREAANRLQFVSFRAQSPYVLRIARGWLELLQSHGIHD